MDFQIRSASMILMGMDGGTRGESALVLTRADEDYEETATLFYNRHMEENPADALMSKPLSMASGDVTQQCLESVVALLIYNYLVIGKDPEDSLPANAAKLLLVWMEANGYDTQALIGGLQSHGSAS